MRDKTLLNNSIFLSIIALIVLLILVFYNQGCTSATGPQLDRQDGSYSRINDNETRIINGVEFTYWGQYTALRYNYVDSTLAVYGPYQVNPEPDTEYDNFVKFRTGEVTKDYIQITDIEHIEIH